MHRNERSVSERLFENLGRFHASVTFLIERVLSTSFLACFFFFFHWLFVINPLCCHMLNIYVNLHKCFLHSIYGFYIFTHVMNGRSLATTVAVMFMDDGDVT